MENLILEHILDNNGSVLTSDLLFNLCDTATLSELLCKNEKFVTCLFNGTPKVVVRSPVRLCLRKDCPGCGGLHLCKGFLLTGSCQFSSRRRGCIFSHDLHTGYNDKILREFGLETLSRPQLCVLLLQSNNNLLPPICYNYNNLSGCEGSCQRLHICEKFLSQDCSCFRTHDFQAPQPQALLESKRIPDSLIKSLKSAYANKEALRLADKSHNRRNGGDSNSAASPTKSAENKRGGNNGNNSGIKDTDEICMYFIKGHCKHGDQCFKAHDKMPYRWQIKQDDKWTNMAQNEKIEQAYCDPANAYSTTCPLVYFDTMKCGEKEVRRCSTINSVREPDFIHTTDWLWFWEDEHGTWQQYGAHTSVHELASITSKKLEEMYEKNSNDVVQFKAGSQSYKLSFQDMIQTNIKYGTKRVVRRRPLFVSATEVQTKRKRPANHTTFPNYWDKTQISPTEHRRVSLQPSLGEYKNIQDLFCQTMKGFDILKIERIQNKAVWEAFQLHKNHMNTKNNGQPVTEKNLFHGTDPSFVDTICATNFDWRVCGVNGTAYGQGSYFACNAKYSHSYTGNSDVRFMFVSRVLVGEYTKGRPEYRRPPSKDGGDVNLYDSCVDDVWNPSIFVVFEKQQIYPEYVIQYKERSQQTIYLQPPTLARQRVPPVAVAKTAASSISTNPSVVNPTISSSTSSSNTFTSPPPSTSTRFSNTPTQYSSQTSLASSPNHFQTSLSSTSSAGSSYSFGTNSRSSDSFRFAASTLQPTRSTTRTTTAFSTPPAKKENGCVIA